MHWHRPPSDRPLRHVCDYPSFAYDGDYFECDTCGKDYIFRYADKQWLRPTRRERKRIRRLVGIDEHCPGCGYRSWRNYTKRCQLVPEWVGHNCPRHELTHEDIPDMGI